MESEVYYKGEQKFLSSHTSSVSKQQQKIEKHDVKKSRFDNARNSYLNYMKELHSTKTIEIRNYMMINIEKNHQMYNNTVKAFNQMNPMYEELVRNLKSDSISISKSRGSVPALNVIHKNDYLREGFLYTPKLGSDSPVTAATLSAHHTSNHWNRIWVVIFNGILREYDDWENHVERAVIDLKVCTIRPLKTESKKKEVQNVNTYGRVGSFVLNWCLQKAFVFIRQLVMRKLNCG